MFTLTEESEGLEARYSQHIAIVAPNGWRWGLELQASRSAECIARGMIAAQPAKSEDTGSGLHPDKRNTHSHKPHPSHTTWLGVAVVQAGWKTYGSTTHHDAGRFST